MKKSQTAKSITKDKRTIILEKALGIFAINGYHTSTMAEIADTAGVAKGTLYNYFKSKEELLRTLVFETILELAEMIDPDQDGVVTEDEFFEMINKSKEWLIKNRDFLALYFSVVMQPKVFKLFKTELWEILGPYMKKLESFFRDHGFRDPETEVRFFMALLDGIEINYVLDPETFPLDISVGHIVNHYKMLLKDASLFHR